MLKRIWWIVGLGCLAAAVAAALGLFWPKSGAGSEPFQVPDFPGSQPPPLSLIDMDDGLPEKPAFYGPPIVGPSDGTTVFVGRTARVLDAYREQLTAYDAGRAALEDFETGYPVGYKVGRKVYTKCKGRTDTYELPVTHECSSSYLPEDLSGSGAYVGFSDGRNGYPANVKANDRRPASVEQPRPLGEVVVASGLNVEEPSKRWALLGSSVQPDAEIIHVAGPTDGQFVILFRRIVSLESYSGVPTTLVSVDAATGKVTSALASTNEELAHISAAADGVVVVAGSGIKKNTLKGLSARDLNKTIWESSANAVAAYSGWIPERSLDDKWVLSDVGYLSIADGSRAAFAADAGTNGVSILKLPGEPGSYVKSQMGDSLVAFKGFDLQANRTTWSLPGEALEVRRSGDILMAAREDRVEAYRIVGDDLELLWQSDTGICAGGCNLAGVGSGKVAVLDNREARKADDLANGVRTHLLSVQDGSLIGTVPANEAVVGATVLYARDLSGLTAYDVSVAGEPRALWRAGGSFRVANLDGFLTVTSDRYWGRVGVGESTQWDSLR